MAQDPHQESFKIPRLKAMSMGTGQEYPESMKDYEMDPVKKATFEKVLKRRKKMLKRLAKL